LRLPRWIRHDIGIKVAALALALFLWVSVAERREVELTVDLPLRYTDLPSDMTFTAPVPRVAKARIRGRGKLLRWRLRDVYFNINLSAATEGTVTHVVSSGEAQIPPDKDIEVLEVLEPKAIRVELDKLVTREVPVGVRLRGEVPNDKVIIGRTKPNPASVVVDGGEKIVGSLDSVRTEPVDLGQLAKKGRVEAKINLAGLPYVTSTVERVEVDVRAEDRKELGIPAVPIDAPVGRGDKALFTPDSLDIVISGATSQVDSLDPQELRLEVDAHNLPKGQLLFKPQVRDGQLYFDVRTAGPSDNQVRAFEVKGKLVAPYAFDMISAEPPEIGFVKR
jgi:YbbR domain-containing protein